MRSGSLVAWDSGAGATAPFRILGAHTDSPNLRVKPRADAGSAGWRQLAVEVYGGVLVNSWLDRDLGLSGRLLVRDGATVRSHLVKIDAPILRVPQLAIHLAEDRKSVRLDPQRHVNAVWGSGDGESVLAYVVGQADVGRADVLVTSRILTPRTLGWVVSVNAPTASWISSDAIGSRMK